MATSAELKQICKEFEKLGLGEIDYENLKHDEIKKEIRRLFDKKYAKVNYPVGADRFSRTLLRFLTEEYDWVLEDKEGSQVDYNYERSER